MKFMKTRPVWAELFQTDMTKLIVAFRSSQEKRAENYSFISYYTIQSVMLSTPLSYLEFPGFEFRSDGESRSSQFLIEPLYC
jgi:hypothetical protein